MGSRPFPSLVASLTVVSLPPAQAPEGSSGWGGLSERLFRGFHTPSPPTGPNHVSLQQTAQSTLPTTSMSMSGSGHGSGPGYSHSGPASQSVPLQSQGAISNYVSRANINMQSNPGTAPFGPWPPPLAASRGARLVGTGLVGGGLGCSHGSFRGGSEGWWHAPPTPHWEDREGLPQAGGKQGMLRSGGSPAGQLGALSTQEALGPNWGAP